MGKLFRIRVDRFMLHYTAAGSDPYDTAVTFGYLNAALSALAPICAKKYKSTDADVRTEIDFMKDKTEIDFGIALSFRLCHIFGAVNTILFGALGLLIKNKLRLLFEKIKAKKEKNTADDDPEQMKENIQQEERNE